MNEELYSYFTKFTIVDESTLNDFWSFLIFRLQVERNEKTYDRFARLYNVLLKESSTFESPLVITLKESMKYFHLVIEHLPLVALQEMLSRLQRFEYEYRYEYGVLKYAIEKNKPKKLTRKVKKIIEPSCTFLEPDDLADLINIIEKLQAYKFSQVFEQLQDEELNSYKGAFSHYASILRFYPQLTHMASIIGELAVLLSLYANKCLEEQILVRRMLEGFSSNLAIWQKMIFMQGGEELDFLDNSFKADLDQFKMVLNLYDSPQELDDSLDAIFEF